MCSLICLTCLTARRDPQVSIGGADRSIFQWRVVPRPPPLPRAPLPLNHVFMRPDTAVARRTALPGHQEPLPPGPTGSVGPTGPESGRASAKKAPAAPPTAEYAVAVFTKDVKGAGSTANVTFALTGPAGLSTPTLPLENDPRNFERGRKDVVRAPGAAAEDVCSTPECAHIRAPHAPFFAPLILSFFDSSIDRLIDDPSILPFFDSSIDRLID